MYEEEARLPVHLLIDAVLMPLNGRGLFYYIKQRGEKNSGMILLKLNGLRGKCRLLQQQRNLDGVFEWVNSMREDFIDEVDVDQFVERSISRDPDLWVIEIEDTEMTNPFDV